MESLYNILINTVQKLLPLGGRLGDKMKLFSEGRRDVFEKLESKITPTDRVVWIHAASLGEFEQAVPVIEQLKKDFSFYRFVVSFFSPSGYEIKKNSPLVDVVTYLPLDTKENAKRFLDLVHPEWAIFIKYEFWPNLLLELKRREIRTLLVSGSFRKDQVFFKSYGKWMQKYLHTFQHFFVQNEESLHLLKQIGFENITVSGDTRFDRVSAQLNYDNALPFVEEFINSELCLVAGSTWPEDEELLLDFINSSEGIKVILAPHTLDPARIDQFRKKIDKKTLLFSEMQGEALSGYSVLIVDTIGLLSRIYSYADVSYVGGAAGTTGLHNILEPATFGVPVVIGANFDKFPEAKQLQSLGGLFSVSTSEEATSLLMRLFTDKSFRDRAGEVSRNFVASNTGATTSIVRYIHNIS